jgi:beta-glucosidase
MLIKKLLLTSLLLAVSLSIHAEAPVPAAANSATVPVPRNDWLVRHEGFNAISKKGGVDLLFIGDSITDGWARGGAKIFLDFGAKFLQPDGVMSKDLLGDLVHPTTAGYQIWADAMQEKLTELLR